MNILIKDIPLNDRPIERLLNTGVGNLTNEELLAIILKTGTKSYSSKMLAANILKEVKDIRNLTNINYQQLIKIKGIGKVKACTILSLVELARRINKDVEVINNIKVNSAEVLFKYFRYKIVDKKQEYFYCIYLDNSKKIIKEELLFIGTINYSLIHPREVFKEACMVSASSIICIHNHPTGNVNPSKEDIYITKKLVEIGNLMDIKIIDHVIVSYDSYYSFFENNII